MSGFKGFNRLMSIGQICLIEFKVKESVCKTQSRRKQLTIECPLLHLADAYKLLQ